MTFKLNDAPTARDCLSGLALVRGMELTPGSLGCFGAMKDTREFYDQLADSYHLIFEDWDQSIARQADSLSTILRPLVPANALILDVAAGIGTQTIALTLRGFRVIASDLSV